MAASLHLVFDLADMQDEGGRQAFYGKAFEAVAVPEVGTEVTMLGVTRYVERQSWLLDPQDRADATTVYLRMSEGPPQGRRPRPGDPERRPH